MGCCCCKTHLCRLAIITADDAARSQVLCLDSGLGRRLESGFMDARRRAGSFLEICKQWLACVARRDRILTPAAATLGPRAAAAAPHYAGSCLQGVKDYSSHARTPARPLRCNLLLDPDSCCPPPALAHLHTYIRTCVLAYLRTYYIVYRPTYLPWPAPRPVLEPCEPPACSASARAFVCINAAAQRASSGGGEDHPSSLSQASLP